jgi:MSHA biogenesis protein MshP
MSQKSTGFSSLRRQRGVSVLMAVFLLLLMATLAAGMVTIVTTSNVNIAADIGGSRAYQAARAGAEWGMFQLDPNGQSANLPPCRSGNPPIPGHQVNVTCLNWDTSEGSRQIRIYRISSLATANGVKAPGIERLVEVTVEKCRDATITVAPYDC